MELTAEEADHFLKHGWLRITGAINPSYIDKWIEDMWVRTGLDPTDKSTWKDEYLHLAHHRQIPHEEFSPAAWGKIVAICGGEDKLHPVRERRIGDSLIINFGSDERKRVLSGERPQEKGFHIDNDWFRQFLDSSETALTIIHCFTDIPNGGGGTILCEDGIAGARFLQRRLFVYGCRSSETSIRSPRGT